MRTECVSRSVSQGTNALASSIVIACRKRPMDARSVTRREFINALHREMRPALEKLQSANIAPVDLAQSAIGPGIGACCFEVGPEVVAAAEALLHAPLGALARPRADGKALLDLKGVNARRLVQLGVPAGQITVSDACTMCRPDVFWSHRATDGRRGVQAAVITL